MEEIKIESPAKINIGLNIIEKRKDGYHNLETVFYPLLLSDKLTFRKAIKLEFNSNSDFLNNSNDNLILKAIRLLENRTGLEIKVSIYLEKLIPIGAGLGGGSSNAAVTLKTINRLFDLKIDNKALKKLSLELGSDVPFFLSSNPCYAESRGEILYPIKLEIQYPILVITPGIQISTQWAFNRIIPGKPLYSLRKVVSENFDLSEIKSLVKNDFESVIFKEYPLIEKIKNDLYERGADFALMSGTGSSVYGIFSNLQKAFWAEEYFRQSYFTFLNNPFNKSAFT
jgi:4-diphosphocytidyl-2-C-methyl-D-erythritol kinase